tara:strand:- start:1031 stop:1951 length:921 start_codon:yes stop_codon:yes gene_type:complete
MKIALPLIILAFPTLLWGDAGFSISYRSTPVIVEKNWLNDTNWPDQPAFYEGIVTQRTLNMVSVNIYFDDTIKAHDKKTTGGHYEDRHYISVYEEPSRKYPVGRMIEKEIDIGDATAEEINAKNAWRDEKVPKVYKKKVWVDKKVDGWLPDWLNPNKGAGYIAGVNFNYAAEKDLVEYYSGDIYIGKRFFILPHLFHIYFKVGPSFARYNYDFVDRSLFTETKIGGFYNIGLQFLVVKGIKVFAETEFRGYGPAPMSDSFNLEKSNVEFVNALPPFSKNYKDTNISKKWARDLITQGIRFGLKFNL